MSDSPYDTNRDQFPFPLAALKTPREWLIETLVEMSGKSDKFALQVVDALDVYLSDDEGSRTPAPCYPRRNPIGELAAMRAERDAAVARAEEAERALVRRPKAKKGRRS